MAADEIRIKTGAGSAYPVFIENGSMNRSGTLLRALLPVSKALLVCDTTVHSLFGEQVETSLAAEKWSVTTVKVRPGERSKTLSGAARLYDAAAGAGLDRDSPVIALGGGVVGDLAGFAAATYLRGLPLVMIPTTLLAQVDSSVGGKVAVNHPRGKNLVGSIYPPRAVIIDPGVLKFLPRRQLRAGLSEVIKYGIIMDGPFFRRLEEDLDPLLCGDRSLTSYALARSVRSKARVVEADEMETGYRRILNFGHTVGHALEAATRYRHYLHGEAVLVGMAAASAMALRLGILDRRSEKRIRGLISRVGLKPPPAGLTVDEVIDKLRQDKKRRGGKDIFVLPSAIGSAVIMAVGDRGLVGDVVGEYLLGGPGWLDEKDP